MYICHWCLLSLSDFQDCVNDGRMEKPESGIRNPEPEPETEKETETETEPEPEPEPKK